jgi:hypothetical protein
MEVSKRPSKTENGTTINREIVTPFGKLSDLEQNTQYIEYLASLYSATKSNHPVQSTLEGEHGATQSRDAAQLRYAPEHQVRSKFVPKIKRKSMHCLANEISEQPAVSDDLSQHQALVTNAASI